MRTQFDLAGGHGPVIAARLSLSALGVCEALLNGRPVGPELLTPGWTSYEWRVRYAQHDVIDLLASTTVLAILLGNGWYRGRLGWTGMRAVYGDDRAAFAQLEITYADGHVQHIVTDESWRAGPGAITADDLYDGQDIDARRHDDAWLTPEFVEPAGWDGVRVVDFDTDRLSPRSGPPVTRTQQITPERVWTTAAGHTLLDFGQNLVGWIRLVAHGDAGSEITVRHAEVLEDGELGIRPLRTAAATDRYILSGGNDIFEPTLTFHGFRYAQVDGWHGTPQDLLDAATAMVIGSDLRRIGSFECSDPLLNQLHHNVVWGMRGNFLDIPTDCPQRDERLGWTGDIAVFAATSAFLYDVGGFLRDWLTDLALEQAHHRGVVPFVVPDILKYEAPGTFMPLIEPTAVWSDAAVWVPWALWQAYGDRTVLADQYDSMTAHVRRVATLLSPDGLWDSGLQLGDWLDPDAPPEHPARAKADPSVVATACAYHSTALVAQTADILGHDADHASLSALAQRIRAAFNRHYVTDGIVLSDCATVYALAIAFDLLPDACDRATAGERLAQLVIQNDFRVSTGFAGTPYVTDALTMTGHIETAYRLLQETGCPSWLYPVTMGATTIWERWDSMLPNGSINPGHMTSFNHYALGAVADWMHRTIGGIAPLAPGYRTILIAPQPGGTLTWAEAGLDTPHGQAHVRWDLDGDTINLKITVPEGTNAILRLPGHPDTELPPGTRRISRPCASPLSDSTRPTS
jgi:alpha-L-rhamnosidase